MYGLRGDEVQHLVQILRVTGDTTALQQRKQYLLALVDDPTLNKPLFLSLAAVWQGDAEGVSFMVSIYYIYR